MQLFEVGWKFFGFFFWELKKRKTLQEAQGRTAWGRQFGNGMINTDTLGFTAHLREGERTTKRPEKLLVRFFREAKLGVGPVRDYSEELAGQLAGERSKHCLLVIGGAQTPSAKKEILKVQKNKLYIEVFTCLELLCDVLNHELVPKHEPLSDEEKTLVMKEYNATAEQIPRIRTTGKKFFPFFLFFSFSFCSQQLSPKIPSCDGWALQRTRLFGSLANPTTRNMSLIEWLWASREMPPCGSV